MRYIILILLNTPIILLAFLNIVTKFKLGKITRDHFRLQVLLWITILVVLVGSFPIFNYFTGRQIFSSINLSSFDIVQTTTIVLLFYIVNNVRQKQEQTERRLRDLHQELSIILSATPSRK